MLSFFFFFLFFRREQYQQVTYHIAKHGQIESDQSHSPNKILRSFPPLDAKEIIALTVLIVRNIPDALYAELIDHAK